MHSIITRGRNPGPSGPVRSLPFVSTQVPLDKEDDLKDLFQDTAPLKFREIDCASSFNFYIKIREYSTCYQQGKNGGVLGLSFPKIYCPKILNEDLISIEVDPEVFKVKLASQFKSTLNTTIFENVFTKECQFPSQMKQELNFYNVIIQDTPLRDNIFEIGTSCKRNLPISLGNLIGDFSNVAPPNQFQLYLIQMKPIIGLIAFGVFFGLMICAGIFSALLMKKNRFFRGIVRGSRVNFLNSSIVSAENNGSRLLACESDSVVDLPKKNKKETGKSDFNQPLIYSEEDELFLIAANEQPLV